jgi:UDP-galactose transporter B1
MFKNYKITGTSMMMYLNFLSSILMILFLIINPYSTELSTVFQALHNPTLVFDILLFGICGALGQCFIFHTISRFGSLVLVTTTVTRKMFSVLLSVFVFGHAINNGQWGAVALVFGAIILEAQSKEKKVPVYDKIPLDDKSDKKYD